MPVTRPDLVRLLVVRRPWLVVLVGTLIVGLPLFVALVDLWPQRWHPVLDLAMTEFRVRDVGGRHTPLIGLPGRIAPGPEQGSHPGPLSFYLLAPGYRLFGSSAWALQMAAVTVHLAAIATALWIGHRRSGWRGVVAIAALLAVVVRGYGQVLLTQPWNPYLPVLLWMVVLLAAWAVVCGDEWMLLPMVVAGTMCAQTHVPYVLPCGALTIGAIALVVWRRSQLTDRKVVISAAIGVMLWIPPLIDQVVNDPGNVRKLLNHFVSPFEEQLGLLEGTRLALRHLDVWAGFAGQITDSGRFVAPSSAWRGAVMLAVWVASVVVARRSGPPALRALHAVVGTALLLGVVSMSRIFGLPWFYLTLWAWGTTAVAVGAVVWTAAAAWPRSSPDTLPALGAIVLLGGSLLSTVSFADAEVPEARLSRAVAALAGPTYEAIADGVGAATGVDVTYQVRWSDAADIGSPGFGLLNELERRGLDVSADPFFRVPATEHRVRERRSGGAQVHLATGSYIARWRTLPDAVEVATYEPRDAEEIAVYHQTGRRLVERLVDEGLDDVVALVDTNLFGGSLDPRLSDADIHDFTTLLELGQPMSVFIAPAGLDPPQ